MFYIRQKDQKGRGQSQVERAREKAKSSVNGIYRVTFLFLIALGQHGRAASGSLKGAGQPPRGHSASGLRRPPGRTLGGLDPGRRAYARVDVFPWDARKSFNYTYRSIELVAAGVVLCWTDWCGGGSMECCVGLPHGWHIHTRRW